MEITNEIKAKVFAQYLGHNISYGHTLTGKIISDIEHGLLRDDIKLIIKPLSLITDEDAIEVGKIIFGKEYSEGTVYRNRDYEVCVKVLKPNTTINQNVYIHFKGGLSNGNGWGLQNMLQAYQYLQIKGYDLPQHLLGGKTLQETGLTIYEK